MPLPIVAFGATHASFLTWLLSPSGCELPDMGSLFYLRFCADPDAAGDRGLGVDLCGRVDHGRAERVVERYFRSFDGVGSRSLVVVLLRADLVLCQSVQVPVVVLAFAALLDVRSLDVGPDFAGASVTRLGDGCCRFSWLDPAALAARPGRSVEHLFLGLAPPFEHFARDRAQRRCFSASRQAVQRFRCALWVDLDE